MLQKKPADFLTQLKKVVSNLYNFSHQFWMGRSWFISWGKICFYFGAIKSNLRVPIPLHNLSILVVRVHSFAIIYRLGGYGVSHFLLASPQKYGNFIGHENPLNSTTSQPTGLRIGPDISVMYSRSTFYSGNMHNHASMSNTVISTFTNTWKIGLGLEKDEPTSMIPLLRGLITLGYFYLGGIYCTVLNSTSKRLPVSNQ